MEFNRLLSQAINFYGEPNNKSNKHEKNKEKIERINTKAYESVINEKSFEKWVKILSEQSIISVDTETSSLNPIEADLVGLSFSYKPNKSCYIPINHKNIKDLKKDLVLKKIKPILEDKSIKKLVKILNLTI